MEMPDVGDGQRFIGASDDCFLWIPKMAKLLHDAHPERNIVFAKAPHWAIREKALHDPSFHYLLINLDKRRELRNDRTRELLGINFWDARVSLLETADNFIAKISNVVTRIRQPCIDDHEFVEYRTFMLVHWLTKYVIINEACS